MRFNRFAMRSFSLLCSGISLAAAQAIAKSGNSSSASSTFDASKYSSSDVIKRDVAVIGGGSSGTYGAIKLRDMGKSVVVVEKTGTLGGHEKYLYRSQHRDPNRLWRADILEHLCRHRILRSG